MDPFYLKVVERVILFGFIIRNDPENIGDYLLKKLSIFLHKS